MDDTSVTKWGRIALMNTRPKRYAEAAKSAPRHVNISEVEVLEHRVVELRTKGKTFREINKILGVSRSDRLFHRGMAREGNIELTRMQAIKLEAERLDALQSGLWDRAVEGDEGAVRECLKILERRARMLGLDHSDSVNARSVEVEEAKVRLVAGALAQALENAGLSDADKARVLDAFGSVTAEASAGPLELEESSLL